MLTLIDKCKWSALGSIYRQSISQDTVRQTAQNIYWSVAGDTYSKLVWMQPFFQRNI